MSYSAVVFDLDGTLLDTLGDIASAVNRALASCNLSGYSKEEYRSMIGHGLGSLVDSALEKYPRAAADPGIRDEVYDRTLKEYRNSPVGNTVIYPGIEKVLDTLCERNISMSILSNKEDSLVRIIAGELLDRWPFTVIQGRKKDLPAKPDPSSLLKIMEIMGAGKEECVYVGDSEVDIRTGKNAGVMSAGVLWGYRRKTDLVNEGAGIIVDKPQSLIEIFMQEEL